MYRLRPCKVMVKLVNQIKTETVVISVTKININEGNAACAAKYLQNTIKDDGDAIGDPVWAPTVYTGRILDPTRKDKECSDATTANNVWHIERQFTPEELTIVLYRTSYAYK